MKRSVFVIGGGASGIMAAIFAARLGCEVTVAEKKDRVLKKLLSTGNGRCNFTNISTGMNNYYGHGDTPAFVRHALETFPPRDVISFFEGIGVGSAIEGDQRVYPRSRQASAVVDMLRLELDRLGVDVITGCGIDGIRYEDGGFAVRSIGKEYRADAVIVSAGSYAAADGFDIDFVRTLGHNIIPMKPALAQLKTDTGHIRGLAGLRAEVEISAFADGRQLDKKNGELLFTDYGVSGIAVFDLSVFTAFYDGVMLSINFLPEVVDAEKYLLSRKEKLGHVALEYFLTGLVAKRIGEAIIKRSIPEKLSASVSSLDPRQIKRIAENIADFRLDVTGTTGFKNAQAAAGGVDTSRVCEKTMGSCIVPGLYFSGEALDVVGGCGGYNLQWAWASGYVAGISAAKGR